MNQESLRNASRRFQDAAKSLQEMRVWIQSEYKSWLNISKHNTALPSDVEVTLGYFGDGPKKPQGARGVKFTLNRNKGGKGQALFSLYGFI